MGRESLMGARGQVLTFLVCVFLVSWSYEAFIITSGGVKNFGILGLVALMWLPGLISIIQRFISSVGFADVGFRFGTPKFYAYAIAIPFVLAVAVNVLSTLLDIRGFELIAGEKLGQAVPMILIALALGLVGAIGEELGWRGFLLPKMIEARLPNAYLWSGVIWALWHLPIVVLGGYYARKSALHCDCICVKHHCNELCDM